MLDALEDESKNLATLLGFLWRASFSSIYSQNEMFKLNGLAIESRGIMLNV